MKRATCLLIVISLCSQARVPAQQDSVARRYDAQRSVASPSLRRGVVHWGKWLTAASAAAFTVMGAHEHASSNREYGRLLDLCRADTAACLLGADGRYVSLAAEQLYQSSIHFDRRARTRLLVGQASLLVAAGLFIADLRHRQGRPGNKPFAPLEVFGDARTDRAQVGMRLSF